MYRPSSLLSEDYTGVNEWEDIQRIGARSFGHFRFKCIFFTFLKHLSKTLQILVVR